MNYVLMPRIEGTPVYDAMEEIALRSFRRFLEGEWEYKRCAIVPAFKAHLDILAQMWRGMFMRAFALWESGNNVLIIGADTIALKPITIFGEFDKMMLFWDTPAPKQGFRYYLNGELVYFPVTMRRETWTEHLGEIEGLTGDYYDHIQVILNKMFWSQSPIPRRRPELNYCDYVETPIKPCDARIYHLHGTRGDQSALDRMRAMEASCVSM